MCCWLACFVLCAPIAFVFRREIQASFDFVDGVVVPSIGSHSTMDPNLMLVIVPMLALIITALLCTVLALVGCGSKFNHLESTARNRATAAEVLKAV